MKGLLFTIGIIFLSKTYAQKFFDVFENRVPKGTGQYVFAQPPTQRVLTELDLKLDKNLKIFDKLALIKYLILTGDLDRAEALLINEKFSTDFDRPVMLRYLVMISFIRGRYDKAKEYLYSRELLKPEAQSKVCFLRLLTHLALNNIELALTDWNTCKVYTATYASDNHFWIKTMLGVKLNPKKSLIKETFKKISLENLPEKRLRQVLRLALFLNESQSVRDRVPYLADDFLLDQEVRELLGMIYYRNNNLKEALAFMDGLDLPNALNMRANLFLAAKDYEKAYSLFQETLVKRPRSQNAIDRLLPLALVLNKREDALEWSIRLEEGPFETLEKNTLLATMLYMNNNFDRSLDYLAKNLRIRTEIRSFEESLLWTLLSYKGKTSIDENLEKSCEMRDALSCKLYLHRVIKKVPNQNHSSAYHEENLDKLLENFEEEPIAERKFLSQNIIEQREIMKLDEKILSPAQTKDQ